MEHKHKNDMGLSMVEIIVASVVFGLMIVSVTTMLTTLQAAQRSTHYLAIATHVAQSQIELIRSSHDTTIDDGDFTIDSTELQNKHGRIEVTTNANAPDSKVVTVIVSYTVDGKPKTVRMTTIVDPPLEEEEL